MKCKAAKCICRVQLTQCAICKYACTTRDGIDRYNNKMATGEQFILFFVSLSFVLSHSFSHTAANRYHFTFSRQLTGTFTHLFQ